VARPRQQLNDFDPAQRRFSAPETARIQVEPSGSVGIGTTGPADKLDVASAIGITTTTSTLPLNGLYSSTTNSLSLTTSGV
jgi:hypothetical protein